jgi:hypothetical protein
MKIEKFHVIVGTAALAWMAVIGVRFLRQEKGHHSATFTIPSAQALVCEDYPSRVVEMSHDDTGPVQIDLRNMSDPMPVSSPDSPSSCVEPAGDPSFSASPLGGGPGQGVPGYSGPVPTWTAIEPLVAAPAKAKFVLRNGMLPYVAGAFVSKPTTAGTATVDIETVVEDNGFRSGSVHIKIGSLEIETTAITTFDRQVQQHRVLIAGPAKKDAAKYFVTLSARVGNPSAVLLTITGANGVVFDNTGPNGIYGPLQLLTSGTAAEN